LPSVLFFLASPQKEKKTLVRLNLSARESQNFRPSRRAMIVAHFGFPPSAGPESGQGLRAFHIANFYSPHRHPFDKKIANIFLQLVAAPFSASVWIRIYGIKGLFTFPIQFVLSPI
jgi:hypothetical protein